MDFVKTRYLEKALIAARHAGMAIMEVYQGKIEVEYKEDESPLTVADKRSHSIISQYLSNLSKPLPILSEEGRDIDYNERKNWSAFWLIDPLDGTKEFIKKNGEFTVNIAIIENNKPVFGVIYIPVKNIFYFAANGIGAYKLDNKDIIALMDNNNADNNPNFVNIIIENSYKLPLDQSTLKRDENSAFIIVASRSHSSKKEMEVFVNDMQKKYGNVDFKLAGSSLKLCLIAEGSADIYPRMAPTMEWDIAAGQAIVENSGGMVVKSNTQNPLQYNKIKLENPNFIVSNRSIIFDNYSLSENDFGRSEGGSCMG